MRPEKADLRPEKADLRPERSYFKPERTDLRSRMAWGDTRRKMDNGKLKMEKQNCSVVSKVIGPFEDVSKNRCFRPQILLMLE